MQQKFLIARTHNAKDLPLPQYMSEGAAGMDLYACVSTTVTLKPTQILSIPVGIILCLPPGYEAQIRPRSGLALKHGITMVNAPGTIDADYRGEIQVILINHGASPFEIIRGMRIGQMIIQQVTRPLFQEVEPEELPETRRGTGGFGHTGL